VEHATRMLDPPDGSAWEGTGRGTYKLATGTAAALAGRSFRTVAHPQGPGRFSIDTIVDE
jgi:hypothetical protein